MVVLITGASGFLGSRLAQKINTFSNYKCFCLGFNNMPKINGIKANLLDKKKIFEIIDRINPDIIMHTAALTNVDLCQNDLLSAYSVNVKATKNLVEWTKNQDKSIRFIYISTDQIYNNFQSPATEEEISPLNFYGMSKLWAEDIVTTLDNFLIFRTNFFSFGGGLIEWLIDANNSGKKITLFDDVWFNPIYIPDLIDALMVALSSNIIGTFNLGANSAAMTKADFLEMIIIKFKLNQITSVRSHSADVNVLTALRPLNMSMSVNKFETSFAYKLPSIKECVDRMLHDFNNLN